MRELQSADLTNDERRILIEAATVLERLNVKYPHAVMFEIHGDNDVEFSDISDRFWLLATGLPKP